MQDSILLDLYNAYKKENNIDFTKLETKYGTKYYELRCKLMEIIPFDLTDKFEEFQNIIRNDEREKFEQEKKLILKIGMQIGLDFSNKK